MNLQQQDRFAQKHGFAVDIRSAAYADFWLRNPSRNLPVPDLTMWHREPGLWLPLSCLITHLSNDVDGGFTNGAQHTFSYTPLGGTNDVVFLYFAIAAGSTDYTNSKINGALLTDIGNNRGQTALSWDVYVAAKLGPSAGTVEINRSGSGLILAGMSEYNGISSLTLDSGVTTGQANVSAGTPLTLTTTTGTNAWQFMCANGGTTMSAGSNTTLRKQDVTFSTWCWLDSNTDLSAASHSLNMTQSSSGSMAGLMFSLLPAGGGGGGGTNWGPSLISSKWNRILQ